MPEIKTCRPPMLGNDLEFRICASPVSAKFETDQVYDAKPERSSSGGGLWGGYCVAQDDDQFVLPAKRGPMIATPRYVSRDSNFPSPPNGLFNIQEDDPRDHAPRLTTDHAARFSGYTNGHATAYASGNCCLWKSAHPNNTNASGVHSLWSSTSSTTDGSTNSHCLWSSPGTTHSSATSRSSGNGLSALGGSIHTRGHISSPKYISSANGTCTQTEVEHYAEAHVPSRLRVNSYKGIHTLRDLTHRLTLETKQRSQIEEALDREFNDAFITQVYNYLSLGYPSTARQYDAELSHISKIPVEELRKDDHKREARGHIGLEEMPVKNQRATHCSRWEALRCYIREWGKQHPSLSDGASSPSGWGPRERRGSWAT